MAEDPEDGLDEYGHKLCTCGHSYGWHAHNGACSEYAQCHCVEYDDGSGALQARDAKRAAVCEKLAAEREGN